MACLADDTILALTRGALPNAALDAAHHHLDSCPTCRRLLVALSGGADGDPPDDEPPPPELPIGRGTRIGRYVVRGILGAGGMGAVYSAHDPDLDRCVAIKLLHPCYDQPEEPERSERLLSEARAMARLAHGNVVHIYDVGKHGLRAFIAMELVEGQTLRAWLAEAPRSCSEITAAFLEAGRGLAAAHGAGLLHRDFKPDNVFVAVDGRIKVGDFGLALPLHATGSGEATAVEHAGGTPAYLAPEVIAGAPPTVASDVFSFCASLWEGLHGRRPFAGSTAAALLREARAGRFRPAPSRAVPARLRSIVERGLAAEPAARYPVMAPLLFELAR
ncbi:MAG: serine/threonine-protein kinase [Myxococcales bacterium]